jgi:hypothetical protein
MSLMSIKDANSGGFASCICHLQKVDRYVKTESQEQIIQRTSKVQNILKSFIDREMSNCIEKTN